MINKAKFVQIYLTKTDNSNESFDGQIYSSNGNKDIYITELDNFIYKIRSCSEVVEGILMLSQSTILIQYLNSFEIVSFENERKLSKKFGEKICSISTNFPKNDIFTNDKKFNCSSIIYYFALLASSNLEYIIYLY